MKFTNIPGTYAKATINKMERVQDVYALEVKNAKYRGANFSGIIELVNGLDSIKKYKGAYRANAKLAWFGRVLKKRNPFINLEGATVTIIPCYSGDVVAGLGLAA
jgi:hypothetical protein